MGVVAYRFNIIAADRSVSDGAAAATKIAVLNGELLGADGSQEDVQRFLAGDWDHAYAMSFVGLRVRLDGAFAVMRCGVFSRCQGYSANLGRLDRFLAIGRDAGPALGAMHHGANALEAVGAALRFTATGRGPVEHLTMPGAV